MYWCHYTLFTKDFVHICQWKCDMIIMLLYLVILNFLAIALIFPRKKRNIFKLNLTNKQTKIVKKIGCSPLQEIEPLIKAMLTEVYWELQGVLPWLCVVCRPDISSLIGSNSGPQPEEGTIIATTRMSSTVNYFNLVKLILWLGEAQIDSRI